MRKLLCAISLLGLAGTSMAADPDGTKFWGHVQEDDVHIVSYYLTVPPGESAVLSMKNGYRMEFDAAPASEGEAAVRVYDRKGKQIHATSSPGQSPMNVSAGYSICRGSVTFMSPAPTEVSGCDD